MDNSYFIFTEEAENILVEKFHVCTWEFRNNTALIEFGCEINAECLQGKNELTLQLFVPWINDKCQVDDFYSKLNDSANSRFIFNDSISSTAYFDGGRNTSGVIYTFQNKNRLCILPVKLNTHVLSKRVELTIDLNDYNHLPADQRPNVYIRFAIASLISFISTRKSGITKSTIIYDIKLNERRNIPEALSNEFRQMQLCEVEKCFCFNIVPNSYDLVFFDNSALQSIRTLEFESFIKYLGDKRVKKDELIVVFYKKRKDEPFSFFSIYSKERIGAGQFALAVLINFICGIFLFIPSFRKTFNPELALTDVWYELPIEIYIATSIALLTLTAFVWPSLVASSAQMAMNVKNKKSR